MVEGLSEELCYQTLVALLLDGFGLSGGPTMFARVYTVSKGL